MVFSKESVLHIAVLKRNHKLLTDKIKEHIDINNKNYCIKISGELVIGVTPLHVAVSRNNVEAVSILLRNGANVDELSGMESSYSFATTVRKYTALHIAAMYCLKQMVQILIDFDADVNINDDRGRTAIELAIKDTTISAILIASGSQIETDFDDKTPLIFVAIDNRNLELVKILGQLQSKAVYYKDMNPIEYAMNHMPQSVQFLLDFGFNIHDRNSKSGKTLLHLAIQSGNQTWIKLLLDRKLDTNIGDKDGNRALHFAVYSKCDQKVLLMLISNGANPNLKNNFGYAPLIYAIEDGSVNLVRVLLRFGAKLTAELTELKNSIRLRKFESTLLLLNYCQSSIQSIKFDSEHITWYFIKYCVGVNDSDEILAKIFAKLIDYGCDANSMDSCWGTIMHFLIYAAECHPSSCLKHLFSTLIQHHKCDLNQIFTPKTFQLESGELIYRQRIRAFGTALTFSLSEQNSIYFAEMLIIYGADVNTITWQKFSFAPQKVNALKMLYYCSSQFPTNFHIMFEPKNDENTIIESIENPDIIKYYEQQFELFTHWLNKRKSSPWKLKCICRKSIRKLCANRIQQLLNTKLIMPRELIDFMNFYYKFDV